MVAGRDGLCARVSVPPGPLVCHWPNDNGHVWGRDCVSGWTDRRKVLCQDVKADNPTAFFSLLAVWFLLAFVNAEKSRSLILASVAAGFGMATKYYSVFLAPVFLIAIVVVAYRRGRRTHNAIAGSCSAVLSY